MNLLEYLQRLQGRMVTHIQKDHNLNDIIPYEVKCICDKNMTNYTEWLSYITCQDKRIELIEKGVTYGELFFNYHKQLHSDSPSNESDNT